MRLEVENTLIIRGESLSARVYDPSIHDYDQLQLEILTTGVENPTSKLGFGTTPNRVEDSCGEVGINTENLESGIYEIGLVRSHSPNKRDLAERIDFLPGRDYARTFFEVADSGVNRRSQAELSEQIKSKEADIERIFLQPIDLTVGSTAVRREDAVFVFVKDILIGTRTRLGNFEILPTGSGLDSKECIDFVNAFLASRTNTGLAFTYDENHQQRSRSATPVCVVHFPNLQTTSPEEVRDYAVSLSNRLLLALALIRDAGGEVFDVVVFDRRSRTAVNYSVTESYVGNMLTGGLAGESADSLRTYLNGLQLDPMSRFLVELYRQARREKSIDYQYVRYWQILEILAEGENYDSTTDLLDFDGNRMMDGSRPRKCKGSIHIAFALLRDAGIGTSESAWKNVNVWFAFRSAVTHHGSVERFNELARAHVRDWAMEAMEQIANTGHDSFLWSLKEDVKLILMRRLVQSSGNGP